ncbi:MAG: hypothetical protein SF069_00980 [Phycisphaerae bacterium]|nr:hypothetical protein [Phycisphaerae bacterium]
MSHRQVTRRLEGLSLLVVGLIAGTAAAQVVEAKIDLAGFPAPTARALMAREGQWVPIAVDLRLPGVGLFTGSLRVASEDIDGDIVEFMRDGVSINAEAGKRRYWCYAISFLNRTGPSSLFVDILDKDGATVQRVPVPDFDMASNDDMIVLDISDRQIVRLRAMQSEGWEGRGDAGKAKYTRHLVTSFSAATNLPDRWIGLEAVDAIFWDLPTPSQIGENQLQAVIDWVRRGGVLVLGLGANWQQVADSTLAEIVPVAGSGATLSGNDLKFFPKTFSDDAPPPTSATASIGVAAVKARREALVLFRDQVVPTGETVDLLATWCVGSGRVTTAATSLRELSNRVGNERVLEYVLGLTPRTKKYNDEEVKKQQNLLAMPTAGRGNIFAPIATAVSFSGQRAFFVLAAFGFVVAYSLIATVGTWSWLVRKKLTMHSWTAFTAAAVLGSALGLLAVSMTFGLRQGVHGVAVVDLVGGNSTGNGRCWIGYTNASRQIASFTVGDPRSYLRGMSIANDGIVKFATPGRYRSLPDTGRLDDVPVRATLKQFEGAWTGEVGGTITGQLVADRATGRLKPGSWVKNDLPQEISGGLIFYLDPRSKAGPFDALDQPVGGVTHWKRKGYVPASMNVIAAALPGLKSGARTRENFTAEQYAALETAIGEWSAQTAAVRKDTPRPELTTLWDMQHAWAGPASTWLGRAFGSGDPSSMLMLASTRSLYLPNTSIKDFDTVGTPFTTDGLSNMDISHWLIRGQAVVFLWSEQPGPIEFKRDEKKVRIGRGVTMIRVRLPLQYEGTPPVRDALADDEGAGA